MPTRILIADDNPLFRRTLKRVLESVDHWEIIETQDGDEAVRKSLETSPDLIVLDLAMPVKDGLTAAREISQALPHTPLLMCTMHASAQLEIEAQKSGIRQVILEIREQHHRACHTATAGEESGNRFGCCHRRGPCSIG